MKEHEGADERIILFALAPHRARQHPVLTVLAPAFANAHLDPSQNPLAYT